jgi:hypothetical protein
MAYKSCIFSTELIVKITQCNCKIKSIYNNLIKENNSKWKIENDIINGLVTNFHMLSNNKKLSISCSPDTGGEIETVLFTSDNKIVHDSITFHNNIDELKIYLNNL